MCLRLSLSKSCTKSSKVERSCNLAGGSAHRSDVVLVVGLEILWAPAQETTAARGTGLVVSYDYRASKRCILPESIREAIVALEAGGAD